MPVDDRGSAQRHHVEQSLRIFEHWESDRQSDGGSESASLPKSDKHNLNTGEQVSIDPSNTAE